MQEEWRDVVGYEGLYQVSSEGRVIGQYKRVMCLCLDNAGYVKFILCKRGNRKHTHVHRMVAEAFLGAPEEGMEINHKNGIKSDNRIANLEWVSRSENTKHKYRVLKRQFNSLITPKRVIGHRDGKEYPFPSIKEAAVWLGCGRKAIRQCLRGERRDHKGYKWSYAA